MGIYFDPGNAGFQESVRSEIYVDKTGMIAYLNKRLCTEQKYICTSRPRRFGKSMALKMLAAYYSCGCSSEELFSRYAIAGDSSFKTHLNRYHVISLTMTRFLDPSRPEGMLDYLTRRLSKDLLREYGDILQPGQGLIDMLEDIYQASGKPFVLLIDEWDCVMRIRGIPEKMQEEYLGFLRNLFKDQPYVALAYMTGILPVKKYGEHSALNMFSECSMTNAVPFSEFTGFTEEEVRELCGTYQISFEEMRRWYDGYTVDGISIYNPQSVVNAILRRTFDSYWNSTETYEALKRYICLNMDGLKDKVTQMVSGETVEIDTLKFQNDMATFTSADDVLTLLVHLGYLTYDRGNKSVRIPNYEVSGEFIRSIEDGGWEEVMKAIEASRELLSATLSGDSGKVAGILEQVHADNTSLLKYNDENSLACVISLAYYAARKDYVMYRELPAGRGYADVVFVPRRSVSLPAIVAELKYDRSVQAAISQIHDRNYMECLKGYAGKMLLVGINYDKNSTGKKHSCRIEEWEKEAGNPFLNTGKERSAGEAERPGLRAP